MAETTTSRATRGAGRNRSIELVVWLPRTPHKHRADAVLLGAILRSAPLDREAHHEIYKDNVPLYGRRLPMRTLAGWLRCDVRSVQRWMKQLRTAGVIDSRCRFNEDAWTSFHGADRLDALPRACFGNRPNVLRACAVQFGEAARKSRFARSDAERAALSHSSRTTVGIARWVLEHHGLITVQHELKLVGGGHKCRMKLLRRTNALPLVVSLGIRNRDMDRLEDQALIEAESMDRQDIETTPRDTGGATPQDNHQPLLSGEKPSQSKPTAAAPSAPSVVLKDNPEPDPVKETMVKPEAVRALVVDTTVAMHRATAPEPRKEIALADLDGLRRRVERLPARPAILHALFASGAFVVRKGSRKQPLLAEARKLADQLIERHGPEQAKQLVLGVVVEAAQDRKIRDVGAVVAHRVQRQAHAGSANDDHGLPLKAPPQAHRAAWSRLIGAHGAGDTKAFAKALRQLVEVNVTFEQIAERIGITTEALHAYFFNETTRTARTA